MSVVNPTKKSIGAENPDFWFFLAESALGDAEVLFENKRMQLALVSYHGMIEKALKGICAKKGTLAAVEEKHNLVLLSRKAGVYLKVDDKTQRFLEEISPLHVRPAYPLDMAEYKSFERNWYVNIVRDISCSLFLYLKKVFNDDTVHDTQRKDRK